MARTVDNNGIGALYGTFEIHKTGETYDLDADNVGDAVALAGNNTVNHGADGGQLLGRLEHVAGGLATVQIKGVVRLNIAAGKTDPALGNGLVVDGAGCVYQAPAIAEASGDPAGGNIARGTTISIDAANDLCDALL